MKNNLQKNSPEFEDFTEVLQNHKLWIESGGTSGNQAYFMYVNFENFDFSSHEVSGVIFKNCNLSKAVFKSKNINEIRFSACNMNSAVFKVLEIKNAVFENCDISGIKMPSLVQDSNFTKCFGSESIFIKTCFYKTEFSFLELDNANLNSTAIKECKVENCKFEFTDFSYSDISKSNFIKTKFEGCDMHGSVFSFCIFEKVTFKNLESTQGIIKTAVENAEFKDCNFKQCFFEEEIKSKNIKNKAVTKISFLRESLVFPFLICTKIISITFAIVALIQDLNQIKIISFTIAISLIFLLEEQVIKKTSFDGKLKIIKNNFILNTFFLFYISPIFLTLFIWSRSFQFESFLFSIALLGLSFANSLNSVFVINKISLFYNNKKK